MRKLLLLLIFSTLTIALKSQTCLSSGIIFTSQAALDSFPINYPDCTHILGDVTIEIPSLIPETSLEALSQIQKIDGNLLVWANCEDFNGLHNLESVGKSFTLTSGNEQISTATLSSLTDIGGDLELNYLKDLTGFSQLDSIYGKLQVRSRSITNLEGLNNISYVQDYVWISNCDSLQSLYGLHNLEEVGEGFNLFGAYNCPLNSLEHLGKLKKVGGQLSIESFPNLKDFSGLVALNQVGSFTTWDCHIESLDGLQGITETSSVRINRSPFLKTLTGLENLTKVKYLSVNRCDSLSDLSGLDALEEVDDLLIYSNENLTDIAGLRNLDTIFNDLRIHNNPVLKYFTGFPIKAVLGDIWLRNLPEVEDFSTLCCLDYVGGIFSVLESGLTSLAGLEGMNKIRGLHLGLNMELESLDGLDNLQELNFLTLFNNDVLSDLDALSQVNPDSFIVSPSPSITITDNPELSSCSIEPLCVALQNPGINSQILNNLPLCNTREAILSQCITSTSNENLSIDIISIYPNPFHQTIWIESKTNQSLLLLNSIGQLIRKYDLVPGTSELNLGEIPAGIYFLKMENHEMAKVIKI